MKYFTKLNIISAFNRLWMKKGQEKLMVFHIRFKLYEFLMMPFELTGVFAMFQWSMNDILREHLNIFVTAYLDNILIYSKICAEHQKHVKKVLKLLQNNELYMKIKKCKFSVSETKFLKLIIG